MKSLESRLIHGNPPRKADPHGALKVPVYNTAAYEFPSAQAMEEGFKGISGAHGYSRISNPTVEELQNRLCILSGAGRAIAVSSGMAAVNAVLTALLQPGDHVITHPWLFGNTLSLLNNTLGGYGVKTDYIDLRNLELLEQSITSKTRCVFVETLSNPQLILHNIPAMAQICENHGIPLVVDNSLLTPYIAPVGSQGCHVEILSTTKAISGGGTGIGGAILFHRGEIWSKVPKLQKDYETWGEKALEERIYREVYRNQGACQSPQNAWQQILGLETLTLRVDRAQKNALKIAQFLEEHSSVKRVIYPGLENYAHKELIKPVLQGNHGQMILFDLSDRQECFKMLDRLKMIRRATNFWDNKSLIIHPASTIYHSFSEEELLAMDFSSASIRLSVGIEGVEDILEDLETAIL